MAGERKILVAEDDRTTREMLRMVLERAGYQVLLAEDGRKAVKLAASEKPDLVISDGLLPRLHGFLVCKAIKEFANPPKVVLMTGIYTKPTYKWEVKKDYSADDLLIKPVKPADLLACVEKHLSGSAARHASASRQAEMTSGFTIVELVEQESPIDY